MAAFSKEPDIEAVTSSQRSAKPDLHYPSLGADHVLSKKHIRLWNLVEQNNVPAGVHHWIFVSIAIHLALGAGVGEPGELLDRQSVHVMSALSMTSGPSRFEVRQQSRSFQADR